MEFRVGEIELLLFLGIVFALLSLVVWRIRGRGVTYFLTQFFGIACVILAVAVLFEKVTAARLAQHIRAEHGITDASYGELFGSKPNR
jgi:hypothetical protein